MFNEKTRIFVTGDLHGNFDIYKLNTTFWPEQKILTANDVLIQAGDFGIIWKNIPDKTEKYWLKWLDKKNHITLFIAGNHDNFNRLNEYPEIDFCGGKAAQVAEKVFYLKNGYIYTIGNKTFWCFGGADSIDKNDRTPYITWWPEEIPTYAEMQFGLNTLENNGYAVDYIITHTMPKLCIKTLFIDKFGDNNDYIEKYKDPVAVYLEEVLDRMRWGYKHWFVGHFHCDVELKHFNLRILYNDVIEILEDNNYDKI